MNQLHTKNWKDNKILKLGAAISMEMRQLVDEKLVKAPSQILRKPNIFFWEQLSGNFHAKLLPDLFEVTEETPGQSLYWGQVPSLNNHVT